MTTGEFKWFVIGMLTGDILNWLVLWVLRLTRESARTAASGEKAP